MSKGQRIGLIALAVVIAAVAFVLAKPDDEESDPPAPAAETTAREPANPPTATTESRPEERLELRGRKPVGGVRQIRAKKGDFVRLTVESDVADDIHLHGYDIRREVRPAEPARFAFRAEIEGVFELESHVLEDQGGDAVIARLVVE